MKGCFPSILLPGTCDHSYVKARICTGSWEQEARSKGLGVPSSLTNNNHIPATKASLAAAHLDWKQMISVMNDDDDDDDDKWEGKVPISTETFVSNKEFPGREACERERERRANCRGHAPRSPTSQRQNGCYSFLNT